MKYYYPLAIDGDSNIVGIINLRPTSVLLKGEWLQKFLILNFDGVPHVWSVRPPNRFFICKCSIILYINHRNY